jgi:hypothetical protein
MTQGPCFILWLGCSTPRHSKRREAKKRGVRVLAFPQIHPVRPSNRLYFYQSTSCCVLTSNQSGAIASGVKGCSSTAMPLAIAYLTVPHVPLPLQLVTVNPSGQALFGQAFRVPPIITRASTITRLRFCNCQGFQLSASYRYSLQFAANSRASASKPLCIASVQCFPHEANRSSRYQSFTWNLNWLVSDAVLKNDFPH